MRSKRAARGSAALALVFLAMPPAYFAWLRYATFHNQTFDLAFYSRIAWGWMHGQLWEPIVGATVFALHLSWVLIPLGMLGWLGKTVPVLLVAQALALTLAAYPLGLMAARRHGPVGGVMAAAAYLLYPNLWQVATFEFHPGTLALLPLAWALEAYDRRDLRAWQWSSVAMVACREDLALIALIMAVLMLRAGAVAPLAVTQRRLLWRSVWAAAAYPLIFAAVLLPLFGPAQGSAQAHFGAWRHWLTQPGHWLEHFSAASRLLYLPKILLPLAGLPLLSPLILAAAPVLAINWLSTFPGTLALDSHYLTPAVPIFVAAAIVGLDRLRRRWAAWVGAAALAAMLASSLLSHRVVGSSPLGARFDRPAFRWDERGRAAAAIVARIPAGAAVQAPDALLPHLAERRFLHRAPPPQRDVQYAVLDASVRQLYRHDEALLRTDEEPVLRSWLAKTDFGLLAAAGPYLLFQRRLEPRQGLGAVAIIGHVAEPLGVPLTGCLAVERVWYLAGKVKLDLVARGECPADLALRLGKSRWPAQVDLLFDGLLSPQHLRAGDLLQSQHFVGDLQPKDRLCLGVLRESGARPEFEDSYTRCFAMTASPQSSSSRVAGAAGVHKRRYKSGRRSRKKPKASR